jgi:hypothetical protein
MIYVDKKLLETITVMLSCLLSVSVQHSGSSLKRKRRILGLPLHSNEWTLKYFVGFSPTFIKTYSSTMWDPVQYLLNSNKILNLMRICQKIQY